MRTNNLNVLVNPTRTPVDDNLQPTKQAYNNQDNSTHSIFWWVALFAVFIAYGFWQNKGKGVEGVKEQLKPANMSANLHNIVFVTFAALIGLVGGKVLFIKLAAWTKNIPVLGTVVNYVAQLFAAV